MPRRTLSLQGLFSRSAASFSNIFSSLLSQVCYEIFIWSPHIAVPTSMLNGAVKHAASPPPMGRKTCLVSVYMRRDIETTNRARFSIGYVWTCPKTQVRRHYLHGGGDSIPSEHVTSKAKKNAWATETLLYWKNRKERAVMGNLDGSSESRVFPLTLCLHSL